MLVECMTVVATADMEDLGQRMEAVEAGLVINFEPRLLRIETSLHASPYL